MVNSADDLFNLSDYTFGDRYYHWCIFDEGYPSLQNKDLQTENDVIKEILSKKLGKTFKVIRTVEPLQKMLDYFNRINSDIISMNDFLDENSIFVFEHDYIVDVTDDILGKLVSI